MTSGIEKDELVPTKNLFITFVIPTKDRPLELRRLLKNLLEQSSKVDAIVIVDAGSISDDISKKFPGLPILYCHYTGEPSAAAQRNAGFKIAPPETDWVIFFDDDQVFQLGAIEKLYEFLLHTNSTIGGVALFDTAFRYSRPFPMLRKFAALCNLYPAQPGQVALSGWHSTHHGIKTTTRLQWASSGALAVRYSLLQKYCFDSFFRGYSYLEDLDFTFSLSKEHSLLLAPDIQFEHYHAKTNRISRYRFGQMEVTNRIYFVRKHSLSLPHCYITLFLRFLVSLGSGQFQRAAGNLSRIGGVR